MNRRPLQAFIVAAAISAASALAQAPAALDPVTVTLAQSGTQVELATGQSLVVRLESNPSTGFGWSLVRGGKSRVIQVQGESRYDPPLPAADGKPVAGASGVEAWTLVATARGSQSIAFEYRRAWEKDSAPAKTATFRIIVKDAAKK